MGDKLRGGTTIGGNIAYHAGNIPTWNQDTTGNAGTSTKLATARTIALSGDVSGSTSFDGSGNVSITTTVADDSHNHTFANLTSTPATATRWPTFAEVTGKPSSFTPSAHTHPTSQITGLGTAATTAATDYAKSQGRVVNDGNLFLDSGMYGINGSPTNTVSGYGAMIVARNSDTGLQISGGHNTDHLYFRGWSGSGSTFTPWRMLYHSGNLPATPPTNLGITAGTTAGPIVTSSTGTNATLPTASATASGVLTTGAQTIAGVKTFSSAITGNITGNADTATKLSTTRANFKGITDSVVVGELMWKNFGNSHTIFDASNSTTPTGVAKNNTNPEIAWSATYPTLMGYNGNQTYGVRVDSSRYADQLKTARTINGVVFDGTSNITIPTGYNILTTEYLTGFSRNGSPIYGIEVNLGAMPNTSFKDVSFTFNSAHTYWIDNQNSYCANTTASYPLNFTGNIGESISCYLDRTNNKIKILCSDNKSAFTGKIVILYTK